MRRILIIGYGNSLCGDDAIGCFAAHQLEKRFHDDPELEIIAAQQLVPEMAEDISRSQFVLFLDASASGRPGTLRRTATLPEATPFTYAHDLTPSALLSAAEQLYGDAPLAVCLTLSGWSFELGLPVSPGAQRRLSDLVRLAEEEIMGCRNREHKTRLVAAK